jgi:hypothetical protein
MSNLNALGLRKQIEIDRQVEIDDVNRRFAGLLEAVEQAYGVGNLATKPASTRKPRTPKASTASDTIVPTGTSTIRPPAPTDGDAATFAEQDASEVFHSNNVSIREFLLTQPDGAGKAAILEATVLVESVAMASIKHMVENGQLTRSGAKRGTKYSVRTAFDAPVENTPETTDEE